MSVEDGFAFLQVARADAPASASPHGSGALVVKLQEARRRISAMAREGRGPRMSIPAQPTDDDLQICSALDEAIEALRQNAGGQRP